MSAAFRIKLDPAFERELLRSDFVRDRLDDAAKKAAAIAADRAPDDPATSTKDLRSSIRGETELGPDGWVGRVVAGDWKAAWYEIGATGVPARPYLRPAVEQTVGPIEPAPDGD